MPVFDNKIALRLHHYEQPYTVKQLELYINLAIVKTLLVAHDYCYEA